MSKAGKKPAQVGLVCVEDLNSEALPFAASALPGSGSPKQPAGIPSRR